MANGVAPNRSGLIESAAGTATSSAASRLDWSQLGDTEHVVQFYETEAFLLDSLTAFVEAGLGKGENVVVVARKTTRDALDERLTARGPDGAAARQSGRYVALDAAELLSQFMVDGMPDAQRFRETVGGLVARASSGGRRIRVFGEMVALLWMEGRYDAAIQLEGLWNELRQAQAFPLFRAYPLQGLGGRALSDHLGDICAQHARIIPAESYTEFTRAEDRLRAIVSLQQKASSLELEVAERKAIEADLRAVKAELERQVEDLRRLHEMSVGLTRTLDMGIDSTLREVLRGALAVHNAELGLLWLDDEPHEELVLRVHSGFDGAALKAVESVPPGQGVRDVCYRERRRLVLEDVELDSPFPAYRTAARAAGFRACHSTPLISRRGRVIGVLAIYFRRPRRPSEREIRLMDLYAQTAADFIENARLHRRLQEDLEEHETLLHREQIARAEAESANRMKDEFLATVSHELRTPLNAIIGWAHMLRDGSLDPATAARAVDTIERNAKSQARLIEDILDVSRMVMGKLRLNVVAVDLASVVTAAIDAVQLAADSKGIRLGVTLDPFARHVLGDFSRLQQVVWNLLSNAIKFTPRGGRVDVGVKRETTNVEISVSDTGQGIALDFLPYIFDRFRQGDGTTTRHHAGLGLGLAIVRHLVELHGGSVRAESAGEGYGATFILTLPLALGRPRAERNELEVARPKVDGDAPIGLEGTRVLLVDDDQDTLQMLTYSLVARSAVVQAAASAPDALEALAWFKPDVLVSDLAMPGEDGLSLIAKLRALEAASGGQTPAVALTAYARIEDRASALSAGFNMFVPKPVEPDELVATIASLLGIGAAR